jgi:hypothetical protein
VYAALHEFKCIVIIVLHCGSFDVGTLANIRAITNMSADHTQKPPLTFEKWRGKALAVRRGFAQASKMLDSGKHVDLEELAPWVENLCTSAQHFKNPRERLAAAKVMQVIMKDLDHVEQAATKYRDTLKGFDGQGHTTSSTPKAAPERAYQQYQTRQRALDWIEKRGSPQPAPEKAPTPEEAPTATQKNNSTSSPAQKPT